MTRVTTPVLDRVEAGHGAVPPGRVLALGLLTTLAAVAFVFSPVRQPEVTYAWTPADGTAVALPLMPYQPLALTAMIGCRAARAGGLLLSTVPPHPDPTAAPMTGLTLLGASGGVTVTSAGATLGTIALPPGDCTLAVGSDAGATTVSVDGRPVLQRLGDVRPDVAGIFTAVPAGTDSGLALSLTADTRFATTPTVLKLVVAAVCLLALAALWVTLGRADAAAGTRRVRLLPHRWWRPRAVDGVVTAALLVWWVIGAGTVDDGYIAGIVRSRGNGFIGNVYRWLNAPEAPFSWFEELLRWWSLVSPSTPWMRLPSTLLGLLCWALTSRLLLPRLGRAGRRPGTAWAAALAFVSWWVPLNLGLRPEPWVAVGLVLVFLAVERALVTGGVRPLAGALVLAGATTAMTPGGLMAFGPVLAAAVPLLRLLRARTDLQLDPVGARGDRMRRALPLVAVLVAAPASALLLMAYDQGAGALLEAVRIRGYIGGGRPWFEEFARYASLFAPDDLQGAVGRRAAVLPTLLAVAGLAWTLAGGTAPRVGIAAGPVRRMLLTLAFAAVAMTFTPTKWTQHFGDITALGTAVLTLGLVTFGRAAQRRLDPATAGRRALAGLAGITVIGGVVLAGQIIWPFVYGWYRPTFSTIPPIVSVPGLVTDLPVATAFMAVGAVVVVVLAARAVWRRSTDAPAASPVRWLPAPGTVLAVVLVAALALQVLTLLRVAAAHGTGYTPVVDAVATAAGDPCGLQSALLVEADPGAGTLPLAPPDTRPVVPEPARPPAREAIVDLGGVTVPGIAVTDPGATAWYALDARQRAGTLPVVVTVVGPTRPGDALAAEFGQGSQVLSRVALSAGAGPVDRRLLAPPGADTVRLTVATGPAAATPSVLGGDSPTVVPDSAAVASLPRAPVLTPMTQLLPRGTRAILDWPVAVVFPCLDPEPLPPGTAGLARWRMGPPVDDASADITYTPGTGGPFATARLLVTQRRMPTYVRDDPTLDGPQLYRWDPVLPLGTLAPSVRVRTVVSPSTAPHLRVPRVPDPTG